MDEMDIIAKTAMDRLIKHGDFCEIVSDKFVEQGVKRGHIVYVAGSKAIPEDPEDMYNQRVKLLIHIVDHGGHVKLPEVYMMDPRSLQKVDSSKQKKLEGIFKGDFEQDESTD